MGPVQSRILPANNVNPAVDIAASESYPYIPLTNLVQNRLHIVVTHTVECLERCELGCLTTEPLEEGMPISAKHAELAFAQEREHDQRRQRQMH